MPEINRGDLPAEASGSQGGQTDPGQVITPAGLTAGSVPPAAPPSEPAPPASSEPTAPTEYVYPDDPSLPEALRGKKASEVAHIYTQLFDTSKQMASYLQSMQSGPSQPAQPQPAQPAQAIFERDDFITGEPAVIEQKIARIFEQKAAPFLNDVYRGLTMSTMQAARTALPHFARYEAEILQELSQTPINVTAHFNTWKDAHDRVVSRHIDEIVSERGKSRPAPPVTERGNGAAPIQPATPTLSADDMRIADGLGVPRETFLRMKNIYAMANPTGG